MRPAIDLRQFDEASRWTADVVLEDGRAVRIRAAGGDDRADVDALLGGMSAHSGGHRFLAGGPAADEQDPPDPPDLTDRGDPRHQALVAHHDGAIVGVGEFVVLPAGDVAEVAFEIADPYQGLGLGSALFHRLVAMARTRGIRRFVAPAATDNHRMLAVFREAGVPVAFSTRAGVVEVTLEITRPASRSGASEPVGSLAKPTVVGVVRALVVVGGGTALLLAGLAAAVVVAMTHGASGQVPPTWTMGIGVAFLAYAVIAVPWTRRWGTVPGETRARLPGDEAVPRAGLQMTRAVTIDAPPDAVWAWLAQIGADRAGFYSYEWLENLAGCRLRNADRVHPEWRYAQVGELVLLHPMNGLPVTRLEPAWSFAMGGWCFVLEAYRGGRTRLVARTRVPRGLPSLGYAVFVELPHFVMERKMLLGIRRRAQRSV